MVRAERMSHPGIALLCAWTRLIVESLGWSYLVVNEPDPVRFGNVRFLAGYRREWLINQDILADIRSQRGRFAGMSIAEAETTISGCPKQLVRPALLHLVWSNEYSVALDEPLRPSTVLEVPK